jgi:hypothetical protein
MASLRVRLGSSGVLAWRLNASLPLRAPSLLPLRHEATLRDHRAATKARARSSSGRLASAWPARAIPRPRANWVSASACGYSVDATASVEAAFQSPRSSTYLAGIAASAVKLTIETGRSPRSGVVVALSIVAFALLSCACRRGKG